MDQNNYKNIIKNTIEKEYSIESLRSFLKSLEEDKLIRNDKRKKIEQNLIDVTNIEDVKEKLIYLFNNLNESVKKWEEFEYKTAYRYNHLYKYKNINFNKLNLAIKNNELIKFTYDSKSNDKLQSRTIAYPTYREEKNKIYLKFNMELKNKLDCTESLKHIVLVIIHKDNNFIEVRQNIISMPFKFKEKIYESNARSVKSWLEYYLGVEFEHLNLQGILRYIKSNKEKEVKITAVTLRREGMIAELDAANNEKLMLPILDELKDMINSEPIFEIDDNTRAIKTRIEEFIEEINEVSDLTSAAVFWKNIKYKLNAYHGEVENDIPFLRWRGDLKDEEGMNYVTKYIIECSKEFENELND